MPKQSRSRFSFGPARLLRGAAVVVVLLGLGLVVWMADKALRYPATRASQFGWEAPLWLPFIAFVVVCVGVIAYVFVRTARRVEKGEDLFAQRHRRRSSDEAI